MDADKWMLSNATTQDNDGRFNSRLDHMNPGTVPELTELLQMSQMSDLSQFWQFAFGDDSWLLLFVESSLWFLTVSEWTDLVRIEHRNYRTRGPQNCFECHRKKLSQKKYVTKKYVTNSTFVCRKMLMIVDNRESILRVDNVVASLSCFDLTHRTEVSQKCQNCHNLGYAYFDIYFARNFRRLLSIAIFGVDQSRAYPALCSWGRIAYGQSPVTLVRTAPLAKCSNSVL